jgi:glycerol-3-phosphate acyltransferase PlsY
MGAYCKVRPMTAFLYALGGYLAGSIPFAVIVSRILALPDPRTYGSRNIGATNVLRSGHRMAALATVVGDVGKGWVAVLVARVLGATDELLALVGFFAFLGHVFPVWLRFRGGKGVATAAGVLIALDWRVGLAVIAAWLAVVAISRYSSLAAIVAALLAPVATWFFLGIGPIFWAVVAMGVILIVRHKANIAKLARGEESRVGASKPAGTSAP